METEKTIQEFFKLWFWNFQNSSQNQFSNLYNITKAILKYYNQKHLQSNDKPPYSEELSTTLPNLFHNPVKVIIEKNRAFLPKLKNANWSIPQLEWCYYRDTKFKTKLSKEYYPDSRKQQENQLLHLQDLLLILSIFKEEMFQMIVKIILEEKVDIYIPIGTIKELEQIRSDDA